MRGMMFPDGPPVDIGGPRKISCPDNQPHQFEEQTTDHPLQGGPVVKPPVIKNKLKVKWGCSGISDVYKSACPCCDGVINIDRPDRCTPVDEYNVRTPARVRTGAWHRGDRDCPVSDALLNTDKFQVDVEAVRRTSVPWWAYYDFEENVTAHLKALLKEKLGIDL